MKNIYSIFLIIFLLLTNFKYVVAANDDDIYKKIDIFSEVLDKINKEYVDAIQLYLLALRRNTLMKVGLFRENFRFYRNLDIDFSFQVKNENFKLLSNPNIPIKRHVHSVWENTHEKTRDELSKDNYKRFLTKWKNYKHLLIN